MIYREHYIRPVREFYDSDLIKIITGIRRSGKSVILEQIRNEIKQKTDNVIYLNFEDKRILANISNSNLLIDYIENNRKDGKCYIFLDEVQMLDNWQEACKTLRLYNNSIFLQSSFSLYLHLVLNNKCHPNLMNLKNQISILFDFFQLILFYNSHHLFSHLPDMENLFFSYKDMI